MTIVGGLLLIVAGVAMLALPGPGWVAILSGLALLAREFTWAQRLLERLKDTGRRLRPMRKEKR